MSGNAGSTDYGGGDMTADVEVLSLKLAFQDTPDPLHNEPPPVAPSTEDGPVADGGQSNSKDPDAMPDLGDGVQARVLNATPLSTSRRLLRDLTDRLAEINRDIDANVQEAAEFANSPAAQLLVQEQEQFKIVKLLGVPFKASPADVAMCLRSHLSPNSVNEVTMQRSTKFGFNRNRGGGRGGGSGYRGRHVPLFSNDNMPQNNGWAFVTLCDSAAMERLISIANDYRTLELMGRHMRVQEGEIKSVSFSSYRHKDHSLTARVLGARLGLPPQTGTMTAEPLPRSTFVTTNHVHLQIAAAAGREQKQIVVTVGHLGTHNHFRAEISMRAMHTPVLFTGRSADGREKMGAPVLRLHLRRPPVVFAQTTLDIVPQMPQQSVPTTPSTSFDDPSDILNEIEDPDYSIPVWDSWTFLAEFMQQLMAAEYPGYTERSPDPTSPGACISEGPLGQCLVWDFYLGEHIKQPQVIKVLRSAARKPTLVSGGLPEDLLEGMPRAPELNCHSTSRTCFTASLPTETSGSSAKEAAQVADILKQHPALAARALEFQLDLPPPRINSVEKLVDYIQYVYDNHGTSIQQPATAPSTALPKRILTRIVIITPLRILPQAPEADTGNRILRTYVAHANRFLRVTFADEHTGTYKSMLPSNRMVMRRLKPLIHSPLIVGGRAFVFLAYGNSQLREASCWFYDESPRLGETGECPTADEIRDSIGDLSQIRVPGKFAVRLGQAFSSTVETVTVPAGKMAQEPDVERNRHCFSDRVGRISPRLATAVADVLGLTLVPSAFQVRIAGCKGMLTVDPRLANSYDQPAVVVRPSMNKFPGRDHRTLEVCAVAKTHPCFLDRQSIVLLTSLGVAESTIMGYMTRMMDQLEQLTQDEHVAAKMFRESGQSGPAVAMLEAGFRMDQDRHLRELVRSLRDRLLLDIKHRARLFVLEGVSLLGVLDEWDLIQEDEIWFASSSRSDLPPPGTKILVGRSPCLHPGDLRVVTMARRPCDQLAHLSDVVVFSQRGARPVPNMCGGGDLDGDTFFVIWDPLLIPPTQFPPMDYTPPAPPIESFGGVTAYDVREFFIDDLCNEKLGVISNAHLALSDLNGSAVHENCIELAKLHSTAVDFAKTGVLATLDNKLLPKEHSDFMENPTRPMYQSTRVLGKMYRQTTEIVKQHAAYLDDAIRLLVEYSNEMLKAAIQYEVMSEADLVAGLVRKDTKKQARRRDRGRAGCEGDEFWAEFEHAGLGNSRTVAAGVVAGDGLDSVEAVLRKRSRAKFAKDPSVRAKAVAWYVAAYSVQDDENGQKSNTIGQAFKSFLSFAWLVPEPLCQIKRELSMLG
ncbi:RNA dependent RNA polymerase-domain-containing protein [Catenaria anguillulae PL171]|uniref:RNA-dependent RNA polymerase n=1 Tax=Catenaria anguillulae PL171 TaxID=765915 RepID=A0A1Y2I1K7_9FUNG|nr:RNA dependent RNA polymerase-domain-containing protein [Catenaria anguillulae PL171]